MLRILLAHRDAERLNALRSAIAWDAFGYTIVAAVTDAKRLKRQGAALKPDVVLAEMALALEGEAPALAQIKALYHPAHVILLGADATYGSAKAALQAGADDYMPMPVDTDELCDVLQRLEEKEAQEQEWKRTQKAGVAAAVAYRLNRREPGPEGLPALPELLSRYFNLSDGHAQTYYLSLITADELRYISLNQDILDFNASNVSEEILKLNEYLDCLLTEVQNNAYALLSLEDPAVALRAWRREGFETQEFITVLYNDSPAAVGELQALYFKLNELRNDFVLRKGSGFVLPARDATLQGGRLPHMDMPEETLDDLDAALTAGDTAAAQTWLKAFFTRNDCKNIHLLTVELVEQIDRRLQKHTPAVGFSCQRKTQLIKRLLDVESTVMLYQMMQTHLQELMALIEPTEHNYRERIVRETLQYIQTHYQQPFTTEELASALHYSPNHLRYIFKQVTGHTLNGEITVLRLEKSQALLADTSYKVHEIAQRVGYANPSYFIAQFLKRYGMTPLQYRNQR